MKVLQKMTEFYRTQFREEENALKERVDKGQTQHRGGKGR